MAAFFLGFGLNAALEVKDAITSASVGIAVVVAYLTHLFSKNRDKVKEYESAYYVMCGICNASREIADIVKSSEKGEINGKTPVSLMPALEIYTVCSEKLLTVYKEDVYRINSNKLFDPDSVIAVLKFKLHFDLFVKYVLMYMNMSENIDKSTRIYLNDLMKERADLLKRG